MKSIIKQKQNVTTAALAKGGLPEESQQPGEGGLVREATVTC